MAKETNKIVEQRKVNNGDAMNKKKYSDSVSKGKEINSKLSAKMLREKKGCK
jgi:hypothetical protein